MKRLALTVLVCAIVSSHAMSDDKVAPADLAAAAKTLAPSLVRVEYTLQYDKSQAPYGGGWGERCPRCGQFHGESFEAVIAQERPHEKVGFVLSPTLVLTVDPLMHPRFVKDTVVHHGDQVVPAKPASYALNGSAVFLQLSEPLKNAKPLAFDAARKSPLFAVSYTDANGTWLVDLDPISAAVTIADDGRRFISAEQGALIVDGTGGAVGVACNGELALDGSWKGSPQQWPVIEHDSLQRLLAGFEASSSQALPRVDLMFRSPKSEADPYSYRRPGEDSTVTEWHGTGVLIDESTVLVLANLKPNVTARLERIRVQPRQGEAVFAKYEATLKDYGAFIAKLERPLTGSARLATGDVRIHRHTLLLSAEVQVQGETRAAHYNRARIPGFETGWRRNIYPTHPSKGEGDLFLFSREGQLVALHIARRQKVTVESEWRQEDILLPADHLRAILADVPANTDPSNVPLSEEEENRVAWIGVELQELDAELARMNNVSEETHDGEFGGLVTWVYENSPAAQAGIEVGDILLRLHVQGHPKPLDVEAGGEGMYGSQGFPWDRLDELPESYYDRIPAPWPSVDNSLNRKITQLGFGTSFTAEVVRNDETFTKDFSVVESPPHYDSARKYKSEALGLTVRDLTYEVRRYLQRKDDDPGVIIARLEPGSRASVAGVKPYELITHVNDAAVNTVSEFEKAVTDAANQDELRLSMRRMTRGRIVKIKMDAPLPAPPDEPVASDEE